MPCTFGVISPSPTILNYSSQSGADFIFRDSGSGLNAALSTAIKELPHNQPLLIVMPDLPFLSSNFFSSLFKKIDATDITIIPSVSQNNDLGTAALYLREPTIVEFKFGENSSLYFKTEAESKNLKFDVLNLHPYNRDLDTLDDVRYLKNHLFQVNEPAPYREALNQLKFYT